MPEAIENSMLTSDIGSDHLLEAAVAHFCHRDAIKSRTSFSNSDSMLTTERMPEPSISLQQVNQKKKRARPGENSRPRPRDGQLIQDRIKELRELVPNGSKCSIDSLLERTIKHMAYMQNVTEHSDNLSGCAKAKEQAKKKREAENAANKRQAARIREERQEKEEKEARACRSCKVLTKASKKQKRRKIAVIVGTLPFSLLISLIPIRCSVVLGDKYHSQTE